MSMEQKFQKVSLRDKNTAGNLRNWRACIGEIWYLYNYIPNTENAPGLSTTFGNICEVYDPINSIQPNVDQDHY